jgi:hypothetical protein
MIRSTASTATPLRTATGGRSALVALVVLLAALAAIALGAGSAKAASMSFGSDLDPSVQPSNAGTAHECNGFEGQKCTWVMNEAYGNPGGEESPKAGTLKKVSLIAGEAGSFKLQIVKTRDDGSSKVVENGPKITYEGQTDENYDSGVYNVEKFKVDEEIPAGARLAIKTKETSTLRCSSGGDNTLLHAPPLVKGAGFVAPDSDDGCWMLLEGKVK